MEGKIAPLNLVREVKTETIVASSKFWKPLVLDILTILAAVAAGYVYRGYLDGVFGLSYLLAAVAVLYLLHAIEVLARGGFDRRTLIILAVAAGFVSFFYGLSYQYLAWSVGILFLLLLIGELRSRIELGSGLKIRFFRVTKPAGSALVTGIIAAAVILYMPRWTPQNIFLSESAFHSLYSSGGAITAPLASKFYADFNPDASVGDYLRGLIVSRLEAVPEFKGLSPADQNKAVAQSIDQTLKNLSQSVGSSVAATDSFESFVYKYIVSSLNKWYARFGTSFVWIWAIVLFLILRGLGGIFRWIVSFFAFAFYEILAAFNFIHISGESRTHEYVEF